MAFRFFYTTLFTLLSIQMATAQLSHFDRSNEFHAAQVNDQVYSRSEFLVNTRLYDFDSSILTPWIDEITHLRVYGVDFRKDKDSKGFYQYVDDSRVSDLIDFCKKKNLKIIWTLNVSDFTLDQEMNYVKDVISKGLNIVGFEYGGEFYLKKYYFGDLKAKGVVQKIRMDGNNRDYLDMLDVWLPEFTSEFPYSRFEHIIITASANKDQNKTMNYRREFNRKVFKYIQDHSEYNGKVSFSYHIYAGHKPDHYMKDEEEVLTPEKVDWSFLDEKPTDSRWVVTESGYYVSDYSESQLNEARRFYEIQSSELDDNDLLGIHVLINPFDRQNALALYNPRGITPVGEMIKSWLSGSAPGKAPVSNPQGQNQPDKTVSSNQAPEADSMEPILKSISPQEKKWYQFILYSHTLTFSNGKSYDRSYWFSKPDFTKDDIGKPISYFKQK